MSLFIKYSHVLIFSLFLLQTNAQTVLLQGKVTDRSTGEPLSGVNIAIENTLRGAATDRNGYYKIKLNNTENASVYFSYVGYETYNQSFPIKRDDTLTHNVQLEKEISSLPTFEIITLAKPDTIFGDNRVNVLDFAFYENKLLLLTYGSNPKKGGKIILTDYKENKLSELEFDDEPEKLFVDYQKKINVFCKNSLYRCIIDGDEIELIKLPELEFRARMMPCIDTLDEDLIFSNQVEHLPYFDYLAWDRFQDKEEEIAHITDPELERLFRFEYYYLSPKDKLVARKFAIQNKLDKHEVAAAMTGFQHSLYYTVPYCPLYIIDEKIYIFDHYRDQLYQYNTYYEQEDSVRITYHKEVKRTEWESQLLRDEDNDKMYALFQKKGYHYIRPIDIESGKAGDAFQLSNKYVEEPKIKDHYVYYIYRPFGSLQSRFLYREFIK